MRVLRRIATCINGIDTDAGRTEHRLYCGQSETQILASCDDVGPSMLRALKKRTRRDRRSGHCRCAKTCRHWLAKFLGISHRGELSRTALSSTDAQWDTVVRELFWDTSCVDPVRYVDTITSSSITCTECIGTTGETRQFMSVKALLRHQRVKHGFRNPMRLFADKSGVCGACGTNFRTKLRLLDHLSDSRRTHCTLQ